MLLLGIVPAVLVCAFIIGSVHEHFSFDFHTFWRAARQVADGRSPYPTPAEALHSRPWAGGYDSFVYPPPFAFALTPLGALPFGVAAAAWTVALLACMSGALAVMGVRDWRCHGIAFASIPTLSAVRLGAVTPILLLLAAVAWRYRDRWAVAGGAVGAAVVVKLFLWPLALWLLLTRRWKAAAAAIAGAAVVTSACWATIGFAGFTQYPSLLRAVTTREAAESFSLAAVAHRLQVPHPGSSWLLFAVPASFVLVAGCLRARGDRDQDLFAAAVGVALLLTPILWLHYLALLFAPLATRARRFEPYWLTPLLFWLTPFTAPAVQPLWRLAVVVGVTLCLTAPLPAALRPRSWRTAASEPVAPAAP